MSVTLLPCDFLDAFFPVSFSSSKCFIYFLTLIFYQFHEFSAAGQISSEALLEIRKHGRICECLQSSELVYYLLNC